MRIGVTGSSMNNKDYLSGSATPMAGLMKALSQKGHETFWLEDNPDKNAIKFSPVPVIGFNPKKIMKLPKKAKLDLIIIQNWCISPALIAKVFKKYGTKVYFWDDNTPCAIKRLLGAAPYVDKILTHGNGAADILAKHLPVEKIEIFYFATDPNRFKPEMDTNYRADVSFVGTNIWERTSSLKKLFFLPSQKINACFKLYGSGWNNWKQLPRFNIDYCGWVDNKNLNKAFSNATVSINATRKSFANISCVPSNRIFDSMASGTVLLSDPIPNINKLFKAGKHLLISNSSKESLEQIRKVLSDPNLASQIAKEARKEILKKHTWSHRIKQLDI